MMSYHLFLVFLVITNYMLMSSIIGFVGSMILISSLFSYAYVYHSNWNCVEGSQYNIKKEGYEDEASK